jgi:hypothetical protein
MAALPSSTEQCLGANRQSRARPTDGHPCVLDALGGVRSTSATQAQDGGGLEGVKEDGGRVKAAGGTHKLRARSNRQATDKN